MDAVTLDGHGATPEDIAAIGDGAPVAPDPAGLARMEAGAATLAAGLAADQPIYGVTTGLGPRVVERLDRRAQVRMSLNTVRGRAHAVGTPLPRRLVRAAMAARLNGLLHGASGARPAMAGLMAGCLDAGLVPVVGESASIGAADLLWGGTMGLALIGEGEMDTPTGPRPAAEALAAAGLRPLSLAPREGLALASHSGFVAGIGALAINDAAVLTETAQTAAALSMEAFRANLSPLDPAVIAARPQPGQAEAAEGLRRRLAGSGLWAPDGPRRLQDPLSLRNVAQIHGTLIATLAFARTAVEAEINAASDNPVVLGDGRILSSGGFLTAHLNVVLGALAQAMTHWAAATVARMARLITSRLSDLPRGLIGQGTDSAGVAPMLKASEALHSELVHLAQPSPVYPGFSADGVEDVVAHSAIPAKAMITMLEKARLLVAMELLIAAQAIECRAPDPLAPAMAQTLATVRSAAAPVSQDRPMTADIHAVAALVDNGAFDERRSPPA